MNDSAVGHLRHQQPQHWTYFTPKVKVRGSLGSIIVIIVVIVNLFITAVSSPTVLQSRKM